MRKRTKMSKESARPVQDEEADDAGVGPEDLALVAWLDSDAQWRASTAAAPYDGIVGSLPEWFPKGIKVDFARLQYNLLGGKIEGTVVTPPLALTWIDRYDEAGYIPSEVFEVVGQLARWRWIAGLGQKRGLRELGVPSPKFLGRKPGARQPETVYLVCLRKKYPHESAADLYRTLRVIAQYPTGPKNPTPGECPFTADWRGSDLVVLKRGKPYRERAFRNTLSQIDRQIREEQSLTA